MANLKRLSGYIIFLATISFLLPACENAPEFDPAQDALFEKCEELFSRTKVNDLEVVYENEFPYFRERVDLEEYLNHQYLQSYKSDTLVAVELDSIQNQTDSAFLFMKLEWVHADSSFSVQPIGMRWYLVDDEWIKPSLSQKDLQDEFEEELRVYWEAVRAMEKEKEQEKDSL